MLCMASPMLFYAFSILFSGLSSLLKCFSKPLRCFSVSFLDLWFLFNAFYTFLLFFQPFSDALQCFFKCFQMVVICFSMLFHAFSMLTLCCCVSLGRRTGRLAPVWIRPNPPLSLIQKAGATRNTMSATKHARLCLPFPVEFTNLLTLVQGVRSHSIFKRLRVVAWWFMLSGVYIYIYLYKPL